MSTDASINIHAIYEFDIIDKKKIQKYMYFYVHVLQQLTQLGEIIVRHHLTTAFHEEWLALTSTNEPD